MRPIERWRVLRNQWLLACLSLVMATALPCHAGVDRVEILDRGLVLDGRAFGEVGAYEKIVGSVFFIFDPDNPQNARIVDLGNAARGESGLVEASANFMVLQPADAEKRRGVALVEVSNRGGKASLSYFNAAAGSRDPESERHFGDGLLMRMGLTIVWVGWQWDVPEREDQLRLHVPIARQADGAPIRGLVRSDWVVTRQTSTLDLAHRQHIAYPVSDPDDPANTLTVRTGREEPRQLIARQRWQFARATEDGVVPDRTHIAVDGGFQAGMIYELVYRAEDPRVVGLGLAAIRDMISFIKYDETCPFSAEHGIAFGVSQTGRFLRHFLYQGFNTDEQDRQAYDGMLIHTAGAGRGSFNHRFGQPSRDAHRFSAFFYPTDLFPFSGPEQTDPVTGRTDGLLTHAQESDHLPRIFYTNTGYEYWGRAASLLHTTPDGRRDVEPMANERIYHIAGAQHFVGRFPPSQRAQVEGTDIYRSNPVDLLATERALLSRLVDWVVADVEPPTSRFPRVASSELVMIEDLALPSIPGLQRPHVIHQAYRAEYGERWDEGIVDVQPPRLGPAFSSLISQVDEAGNERAGVRGVELRVPLATYTPWSQRTGQPGPVHELADFTGFFIPLPLTEAARKRTGDARPSLESLYQDRDDYVGRAAQAAEDLVAEGFLLSEDVRRVMSRAEATWDWIHRSRLP